MGHGASTWVFMQDGDANGGNVTGSVNVTANNTLGLTTGSVSGTLTNLFPGAQIFITMTTNVTFGKACPATLALTGVTTESMARHSL
jgi:hypothetical protein